METKHIEPLDLNKIMRIIYKRKWLILFCLIGALVPIIIFNRTTNPIYEANTTIVFEEHQGAVAPINPFRVSQNRSFIINQIEEIKSRSLSEEVAKTLPFGVINTFPLPKDSSANFNKERYIANKIKNGISASSVPNSEIIKIKAEAYSPIAAKVIANTIAEVLKQRNLKVRREETGNVRKIIEDQLVTFKRQLDDAEIALRNFKEKKKVTLIDQEAQEIFRRITEAEVAYNQAKANLDAANKRLSFIQDRLSEERADLVPAITKITSPWAQKLKEQLVELEVQYTTLKVQNYAEDHPKMYKLKRQIEQTKNNLRNESLKIAAGENIVDPISQIQNYMEESINLEIEIQTYQAQEKTLKEVIDNYKRNLNTLPDKELHLAQLMRDKEVNEKIYTLLLEKKQEAKIAEAEKVGNIRIIDPAKTLYAPVKPRKLLNLIIGFILGSAIGVGLAFLVEFLDDSVKSVEDAEHITDLSVLGSIPKIRSNLKNVTIKNLKKRGEGKASEMISRLITEHNPKSPEAESFRSLRTNLQFSGIDSPIKTILITSSNPGEGKSLITANLSITTAQMGLKTLLIDADLRKPILHILFQKRKRPGLIDIIASIKKANTSIPVTDNELDDFYIKDRSERDIKETNLEHNQQIITEKNYDYQYDSELLESAIKSNISSTSIANLDILTCGTIPPNPSEILASKTMKKILPALKNQYDAIFVDTPPINVVTDSGILGSLVDGSILVIKAGSSSKRDTQRAKGLLQKSQSNIIGLVVNYIDAQDGYSNHYYYYFSDNNDGKKMKKRKKKHSI